MLPEHFLAYYADPFSRSEPLYAVKRPGKEQAVIATHSGLLAMNTAFCTYKSARLIDALRLRKLPLLNLVDVDHALQLACGRPRRNFLRSEFSFQKWLRLTNLSARERELYLDVLDGRAARPDDDTLQVLLLKTSAAIEDVWMGISNELDRLGELSRFSDYEVPVQIVMSKRQWSGISVDLAKAEELLEAAKAEKYRAMLDLGPQLKVNPTGLTFKTILPRLAGTDAESLQEFSESQSLASHFKIVASYSRVARQFRSMINSNRNIKALLALGTSSGRVFPIIDTMATVTARIQMSNPSLQQLRRAYRSALQADEGMTGIYLDYSQFEPGILAHFTGPGAFRDLYNSGDVYRKLSEEVFGDATRRELSKQIFIAFCYGMKARTVGQLLGDEEGDTRTAITRFFAQFPELMLFKETCESNLERDGFISTALGNRRVRARNGKLSRRERGWAMNHPIQGTGSLIFKDALLQLARRFGDDAILLPIHDAVWLQIPEREPDRIEALTREAAALMESVARGWCPDVSFRVKSAAFGQT